MEILDRLEGNMKRYIYLNISKDYIFTFHHITSFNKKEYLDILKDQATLGLPVKTDYVTASGVTPYEMMNKTFMENSFDFASLWQPLSSGYNNSSTAITSSSTGGAPTKDDGTLTDEGEETRDKSKNA